MNQPVNYIFLVGLPLAVLYGVFCYIIMEYMILSTPDTNLFLNLTNAPQYHEKHDENHDPVLFGTLNGGEYGDRLMFGDVVAINVTQGDGKGVTFITYTLLPWHGDGQKLKGANFLHKNKTRKRKGCTNIKEGKLCKCVPYSPQGIFEKCENWDGIKARFFATFSYI